MRRLGGHLRRIADRIDPANAPRSVGYSFTFEPWRVGDPYQGIHWRDDGRGCPLWSLSIADFERARTEADRPSYDAEREMMRP